MTLKALRSLAPDLAKKYDPLQPRDPDGKWGDGVGGTVKRLLGDLLRVNGGVNGGDRFQSRANPGSTIDWSIRKANGDFSFEVEGDDEDFVRFDLPKSDVERLHAALGEALVGYDDPGHIAMATDDNEDDPRYFDWSVKDEDEDDETIWSLEVGGYDPDEQPAAAQFQLTDQDMVDLHAALTLTLINEALGSAIPRREATS